MHAFHIGFTIQAVFDYSLLNVSIPCSDGSVYSHGTPTDELYTIDFTTFNPRLYLVGSIVSYSDVVYRITFIGMDHYLKQYCYFGPIGGDDGDWKIEFSPVNAFYGDADVGINSIG